jgi:hypothetical protein
LFPLSNWPEIVSLKLREEYELKVPENRALRRGFRLQAEELIGAVKGKAVSVLNK